MAASAATSLTAVSVAAHVLMLFTHGHMPVLAVVLVAMTLACAWCAVHGFLHRSGHGMALLMGMSLAMALLHAVLVFGPPGGSGMHTMHGGSPPSITGSGDGLMLAIVALELAIAWSAGLAIRCGRQARQTGLGSTGHRVVRERMPT